MEDELFNEFEVVFNFIGEDKIKAYLFEHPDISASGDSETEALSNLKIKFDQWLSNFVAAEAPMPSRFKYFSGAVNLRMDALLHMRLSIEAYERNMSLNGLILEKLQRTVALPYQFNRITPYAVERDKTRQTISIFFSLGTEEGVSLTFWESNLKEEIDLNETDWDEGLIKYFAQPIIKENVQKFLSKKIQRPSLNGIENIECVIVNGSFYRILWDMWIRRRD